MTCSSLDVFATVLSEQAGMRLIAGLESVSRTREGAAQQQTQQQAAASLEASAGPFRLRVLKLHKNKVLHTLNWDRERHFLQHFLPRNQMLKAKWKQCSADLSSLPGFDGFLVSGRR